MVGDCCRSWYSWHAEKMTPHVENTNDADPPKRDQHTTPFVSVTAAYRDETRSCVTHTSGAVSRAPERQTHTICGHASGSHVRSCLAVQNYETCIGEPSPHKTQAGNQQSAPPKGNYRKATTTSRESRGRFLQRALRSQNYNTWHNAVRTVRRVDNEAPYPRTIYSKHGMHTPAPQIH